MRDTFDEKVFIVFYFQLRFWYYMYGADVYRLTVYTKTFENGGWVHLADYFKPSVSTVWNQATVPLGSIAEPFVVRIKLHARNNRKLHCHQNSIIHSLSPSIYSRSVDKFFFFLETGLLSPQWRVSRFFRSNFFNPNQQVFFSNFSLSLRSAFLYAIN